MNIKVKNADSVIKNQVDKITSDLNMTKEKD